MNARALLALAGVVVLAALAVTLVPRPETPAQRVVRLASELRCPVCQGLSVEDSPSQTAREMRSLIEQRANEGRSDDEIRAEFRASYGDWIFLEPPLLDARGAVWLLPIAAIAAGVALVVARLGRAPPVARPSDEQRRLLRERELADEALE